MGVSLRGMPALSRHALALISFVVAAFCQTITTGEITGAVTDPADKGVTAAAIHLRSVETGESRIVQSNDSGVYRFVFVKPGAYVIDAQSAGLRSDVATLVIAVGQVQSFDIHLRLEQPKSVALVSDGAPVLNTDNAHSVYTLSTRQLGLLPITGGDLAAVAYSSPGVVINNNRIGTGNFVFQGVGSASNLFTVNGADAMDPYINTQTFGVSGMLLGINEVREASIVQNPFEGQYGRQAGAQINYVTKSGANETHGNLVYSYNGTPLNANDFFANAENTARPAAISNQYAASLGGRVVRNKLFFFIDTEGLRYTLPTGNRVAAIPSLAFESYVLRTIQPLQAPLYQQMFSLYNSAPGVDRSVPVTNGTGIFQDANGKLGCGKFAGTPTGAGAVFGVDAACAKVWGTNSPAGTKEWLISGRVDYNLSGRQNLFFRLRIDHGSSPAEVSDVNPLFNAYLKGRDYEGQLSHTLTITPRLVNMFIGSGTYHTFANEFNDLTAALEALPVRINSSFTVANGVRFAPIGPASRFPDGRRTSQFQLVDDISYLHNRHFVKAGVNSRYNPTVDLYYSNFQIGRFNLGLAEFVSGTITGAPASFYFQSFTAHPPLHVHLYNLGAYVQDQWAATPRLKITATLRFDRTGNPRCVDGCFSRLAAPFDSLNKGLSIPYNRSIQTGVENAFYHFEPIVPEPRLGVVYVPRSQNTVIRGGIGLLYDLYPSLFADTLGGNPPNTFSSNIRTGLVNTGGAGSSAAIAAASAEAFAKSFASGGSLAQVQQAVAPAIFASPNLDSMPANVKAPKSLQWTVEVQRQASHNDVLTIRYVGNHGYDIFVNNPYANSSGHGFAGLPTDTPDPRFGSVYQHTNRGYANYHALSANFRHTFRHGVQGQITYAWSHALDIVSNGGLVSFGSGQGTQINPADLRSLNYSNADYDTRQNVTGDMIWEIPVRFSKRLPKVVSSGWSMGTRLSAHTGTPFSVLNGSTGFSGAMVLADVQDANISFTCGRLAIDRPCFTARQFGPANTQADFGNMPRNTFRGPGYVDCDVSLFKTIPFRESVRLMLGASAYNALNHPNFAAPVSDIVDTGLGLITRTVVSPSGPLGSSQTGLSGRVVVVTGKLTF